MRIGRWKVAVTVAAVVVAVVVANAVWLGQRLRSPAQVAADAAPPAPSLVTAKAEQRVLAEALVLRGQVRPGPTVTVPAPAGATGPDAVVTYVAARAGDELRAGQVLVEVSNWPLIVWQLPFPLFRDLTGGLSGRDVAEAQRALRRMGYPAPSTGTWDARTQAALARFYRDRGYPVPRPDQSGVVAAEQAEQAARTALRRATAAHAGVAEARAALLRATSAVAGARLAAGAMLPRRSVVRVARTGVKITAVKVKVGAVLDRSGSAVLAEIGGQPPYVAVLASREQVGLIRPRQRATVVDETSGQEARAAVTTVGRSAVANAALGGEGFPVTLRFAAKAIAAGGRSVRVDLLSSGTPEAKLAVPLSAVYSRPDGSTFVTVAGDGGPKDVTVTVAETAGGWAAITPEPADAIAPGTPVVVGTSVFTGKK